MYRRTIPTKRGRPRATKLYRMWTNMKSRCANENSSNWEHYGGKGVKVCSQWEDYDVFRDWACRQIKDFKGSRRELSIDRRDPDGDYKPPNCSIISMRENSRRALRPGLPYLPQPWHCPKLRYEG